MNIHKLNIVKNDMLRCFQSRHMSVIGHGYAVERYARRLREYCEEGKEAYNDSLIDSDKDYVILAPKWFDKFGLKLFEKIPNDGTFEQYLHFHDCGKPYCLTVDSEGRKHFPDHEKVSYAKWLEIAGEGYVAQCILHDMDIHRIKPNDVPAFSALPEAPSLLIAGLAEVHANAAMFGGFDSTGFKIKFAQIERRGNQVCAILFG